MKIYRVLLFLFLWMPSWGMASEETLSESGMFTRYRIRINSYGEESREFHTGPYGGTERQFQAWNRRHRGDGQGRRLDQAGAPVPVRSELSNIIQGIHQCAICLDDMRIDTRTLAALPCGHPFHDSCIRAALQRNTKCPYCRVHAHSTNRLRVIQREQIQRTYTFDEVVSGLQHGGDIFLTDFIDKDAWPDDFFYPTDEELEECAKKTVEELLTLFTAYREDRSIRQKQLALYCIASQMEGNLNERVRDALVTLKVVHPSALSERSAQVRVKKLLRLRPEGMVPYTLIPQEGCSALERQLFLAIVSARRLQLPEEVDFKEEQPVPAPGPPAPQQLPQPAPQQQPAPQRPVLQQLPQPAPQQQPVPAPGPPAPQRPVLEQRPAVQQLPQPTWKDYLPAFTWQRAAGATATAFTLYRVHRLRQFWCAPEEPANKWYIKHKLNVFDRMVVRVMSRLYRVQQNIFHRPQSSF